MRRFLNLLYDAAGYLAAFFMIGILAFTLIGVTGRIFSFYLPGTDAYAGYCMAAAGFLALAHTMKRGEHIRVTLLLNALHGKSLRALEIWSLAAAVALATLFAWYSVRLAWQSWTFHDISTSNDATPLWIPQIAMATGTMVLLVALADEFILVLKGLKRHSDHGEEPLHNE